MSSTQINQFARYRASAGQSPVSQASEYRLIATLKLEQAKRLIAEALVLEERAEEEEFSRNQ